MRAFLVTSNAEGMEQLIETSTIEPGQTVQYDLAYTNQSTEALLDLVINGPIPASTYYLAGTVRNPEGITPLFSADGGETFGTEPITIVTTLEDGSTIRREARPDEYTHIQWQVPSLKAGSSTHFYYRVQVR